MKKWQRVDDKAVHQIRLFWAKSKSGVKIAVGCTCRRTRFNNGFEPLGVLANESDSPWPIFNDPANHKHDEHPFTREYQGGPIEERPAAPEAPVQPEVDGPVLDELAPSDMEDEVQSELHGDLLPV